MKFYEKKKEKKRESSKKGREREWTRNTYFLLLGLIDQ